MGLLPTPIKTISISTIPISTIPISTIPISTIPINTIPIITFDDTCYDAAASGQDKGSLDAVCAALKQRGMCLDAHTLEQLQSYCHLLLHWGRSINLVSKRDLHLERLWQRHIYDCLVVQTVPGFAQTKAWLDLGSGAGLPGLLIAVCQPQQHVTSLESSTKKTAFQTEVCRLLALDNVSIIVDNAYQLARQPNWHQAFDGLICRAFGSVSVQLRLAQVFLAPAGRLFSMQGEKMQGEKMAGEKMQENMQREKMQGKNMQKENKQGDNMQGENMQGENMQQNWHNTAFSHR